MSDVVRTRMIKVIAKTRSILFVEKKLRGFQARDFSHTIVGNIRRSAQNFKRIEEARSRARVLEERRYFERKFKNIESFSWNINYWIRKNNSLVYVISLFQLKILYTLYVINKVRQAIFGSFCVRIK